MKLRRAASVSSIYMRESSDREDTIQEEGKATETLELISKKLNKLTKVVTQLKHRLVRNKAFYKKKVTFLKKKIKKHEELTHKQLQSAIQTTNKQLQQQRNLIEHAAIESAKEPVLSIVYDCEGQNVNISRAQESSAIALIEEDINVKLAQAQEDIGTALEAETDRLKRLEDNSKVNKSSAPPQPPIPQPPPPPLTAPVLPRPVFPQTSVPPTLPPPSPRSPPPSSPPTSETSLSTDTPLRPITAATPSPPTN